MSGLDVSENGTYNLLWDAREDLGQVIIERMTMRITLEGLALSVGKVQLWEGGPYWADRNIGAKKPTDYGLYFWWGDTTGHRPSSDGKFSFDFSKNNSVIYSYGKGASALRSEGWTIVLERVGYVLAPSHDAAHVKWGGAWRMPTNQELYDLWHNKCDWTWTTRNGVNGCIVRGRGMYASNSIFLPCAGYSSGTRLINAGISGHFWSSVPYWGISGSANDVYFVFGSGFIQGTCSYVEGYSIRPVQ